MKRLLVMFSSCLLFAGNTLATTWTVDDDGADYPGADFNNIQAAVDAASKGDEILIYQGTYTSTGSGYAVVYVTWGKSLWIHSVSGPEVTIVDAQNVNGMAGMLAYSELTLEGLTFKNGHTSFFGGGIRTYGGTVRNCIITDNSSDYYGGGIFNGGVNTISIVDCTISNNHSAGRAGGILIDLWGTAIIDNCIITGNSSTTDGGGVFIERYTQALISNSTFEDNVAGWSGGAFSCHVDSIVTAEDLEIRNNSATLRAGGIAVYRSSLTASNCTLIDNSALNGGGLACTQGDATLSDCIFNGNVSSGLGDGIYAYDESLISLIGTGTCEEIYCADTGTTLTFDAESFYNISTDVTPSVEGAIHFDLNAIATTASLRSNGTLTRQGSLSITNDSGSLSGTQQGDVIPIAQSSLFAGEFDSTIFPIMPEGLGLRLIETPALRGGLNEMAVEVFEVEGANFTNPFAGSLDSEPVDIESFDADGDGTDEIAVLFAGVPGGVAVFRVIDGSAPILIDGFIASVGNNPVDLDAGDLNGDGLDDLLVANGASDSMSVLITTSANDGSLSFTNTVINGVDTFTCVAIINWDNDADLDAVVGIDNGNASTLDGYQVFLDVAATPSYGSWISIPKYQLPDNSWVTDTPTCVDGDEDTTAWGFVGGTEYGRVHRVIAGGTLQVVAELIGNRVKAIEALELDASGGDNQIDLMVASDEAESIYVFQGDALEADDFGELIPLAVSLPVEDILAIDADGDGDKDIVMTAPLSSTPLVLLRNDGGTIPLVGGALNGLTWSKQDMNSGNSPTKIAGGTISPKGEDDDWVVGVGGGLGLRGDPIGSMEQTNVLLASTCQADIDGDGEVDVADLLEVIAAWGSCDSCPEDFDGNGEVNVADILVLIAAWGPCGR